MTDTPESSRIPEPSELSESAARADKRSTVWGLVGLFVLWALCSFGVGLLETFAGVAILTQVALLATLVVSIGISNRNFNRRKRARNVPLLGAGVMLGVIVIWQIVQRLIYA